MLTIAVGPGGGEPRFMEWTETMMKGWKNHTWSWDMQGLSLHNYTVINWENKAIPSALAKTNTPKFSKKL